MVSIVQSKRLRASNIRFLNDRTEGMRLQESAVPLLRECCDTPGDEEIFETVRGLLESSPKRSDFVASLSTKGDILSQWRAYCPPGMGVSIGFNSSALSQKWVANSSDKAPLFLSSSLQRIRYIDPSSNSELQTMVHRLLSIERKTRSNPRDGRIHPMVMAPLVSPFEDGVLDDEQQVRFTEIALDAVDKAEGGGVSRAPYAPGASIAAWIAVLGPFVKHNAFAEEHEWRKVVSKDVRLMPGLRFRSGKSTLIPFVEIMLDKKGLDGAAHEKYFVDEVVLGPTPTPDLTMEAVRALFDTEGHPEVNLRPSHIPYKDW